MVFVPCKENIKTSSMYLFAMNVCFSAVASQHGPTHPGWNGGIHKAVGAAATVVAVVG